MSVLELVRKQIQQFPLGEPFLVQEMLGLGSRSAVYRALSRLTKLGEIQRVARGFYARPKTSPVLGMLSVPGVKVAQAVARAQGAKLVLSGAEAANRLGLSTQIPTRTVYWSTGPSRTLRVGNQEILIKFRKRLVGAGSAAGPVITALQYLGKKGISGSIEMQLASQLPEAVRRELLQYIPELPGWMEKPLRRIAGSCDFIDR